MVTHLVGGHDPGEKIPQRDICPHWTGWRNLWLKENARAKDAVRKAR